MAFKVCVSTHVEVYQQLDVGLCLSFHAAVFQQQVAEANIIDDKPGAGARVVVPVVVLDEVILQRVTTTKEVKEILDVLGIPDILGALHLLKTCWVLRVLGVR